MASRIWCALLVAIACSTAAAAQPDLEEFARRQYDSGVAFLQNRRYAEALKDFQAVVDSFPKSSVADDALLQIALYELDVAHDVAAAQAATARLLKEYPDTDSAPMAHIVTGRLAFAKGRGASDVDAALASFERVPRLFPGDEAVPAAYYYAGETLHLARRDAEALDRFRRVEMEYPRSRWAARASVAAAACLIQANGAVRAIADLQRVRLRFPGTPESADALNTITELYRLYVRPPAQPAYAFAGRYVGAETAKFKDVVGVAVDRGGRILLAHKQGVAIFDAKATLLKSLGADEPSALYVDERDRPGFARRDMLFAESGQSTPVAVPQPDGKVRPVEDIAAVVVLSSGERLLADKKGKAVIRVSADGKYAGTFASVQASRLAINALDDVAIIDHDAKAINILSREGKPIGKILQKGTGYELDNPVDLAFDALGHLYVLDRGRAAVYVFSPKYQLITTVTVPEKAPGAFERAEAFALDAAGRLYIFDDRPQRIQVYQ